MFKQFISTILMCFILFTTVQTVAKNTLLDNIAGVYKVRFKNAMMNGEQYNSENILEIVPIDEHAAYVRMKLEFANGHSGGIYGIAKQEDEKLVYYSKQNDCLVSYQITKDSIISKADYSKYPQCTFYHGMRGTLDNIQFPTKNKRTIRYMTRLKASRQFKEALIEYQTNK